MQVMNSASKLPSVLHTFHLRSCWWVGLLVSLALGGCRQPSVEVRAIPIQQAWELNPGQSVGQYRVTSGLGDIAIDVRGDRIYAPFDGLLQPNDVEGCYVFSSPDVPAYLFRLCGLERPQVGAIARGEWLGTANHLGFATLRRQPDGHWAIVEPASDVVERLLVPNAAPVGGDATPVP